jgi:hypothetical protein
VNFRIVAGEKLRPFCVRDGGPAAVPDHAQRCSLLFK